MVGGFWKALPVENGHFFSSSIARLTVPVWCCASPWIPFLWVTTSFGIAFPQPHPSKVISISLQVDNIHSPPQGLRSFYIQKLPHFLWTNLYTQGWALVSAFPLVLFQFVKPSSCHPAEPAVFFSVVYNIASRHLFYHTIAGSNSTELPSVASVLSWWSQCNQHVILIVHENFSPSTTFYSSCLSLPSWFWGALFLL